MTGALAGLRVLDLSRVLAGPWCTQILADHGADVLKVEPPQGDDTRSWGPPFDADGNAAYYLGANRNKRGITLDLRTEAGRAVLWQELETADVLVENLLPGTLEGWGFGYEAALRHRLPRLVHCRISGFGADGPLGGLPGYDAVIQAMCGMFSVNGEKATGPVRMGVPLVDLGLGLYAAVGILMALHERERSGLGQYLDMALFDAGYALMHPHLPNFLLSGKVPGQTGSAHPSIAPYDKFPTATVDIFIGVGNEGAFHKLGEVLGDPALADDPRFRTNADRLAHRPILTQRITALLRDQDGEVLYQRLLAAGIAAGPVRNAAEAWADPHVAHRGMGVSHGAYHGVGTPIKLSRTPGAMRMPPPVRTPVVPPADRA